ncbi:hypothetical protein TVAG_161640 [Trichomonas vaginalis G3]|uniref:Uncharacterized protein n=1 Tax=Trichomonas vaginalis (strain ATCC PRA-98 / G3) TaxID=412133 RepID=A2EUN7_TRIV3|nr:hypothetical protein TVAGG3_0255730 [Trichomonas vaginalis G3]EAY03625.1 hypothetical protein TVAG_161640 [Trichomonas vaginalis G3]KAI5524720.1 hypothetical protein TVAGG3_0255730 [Trichomonas vaginalis G3]|eukprot:XP_001315848.1 hypothetical protein [Trichomonas vaginalis G3]
MSSQSSSASSRQVSPLMYRTLQPSGFKNFLLESFPFILSLIVFFIGISYYLQASKIFYCVDELTHMCRECPQNAKCDLKRVIECTNNTRKFKNACIDMDVDDTTAENDYSKWVNLLKKKQQINSNTTKQEYFKSIIQSTKRYEVVEIEDKGVIYQSSRLQTVLSMIAFLIFTIFTVDFYFKL